MSQILVVAQLALSPVAVIGAGLYVRTLHNLRITNLGISVHNLTTFRLAPAAAGYTTEQAAEFARRVLDRLQLLPGVESVALSRVSPLLGSGWQTSVDLPHGSTPSDSSLRKARVNWVTAGFFETMKIPVRVGRSIEERDRAGAPLVALVSETFARIYFQNVSPVGKHFRAENQDFEIVGVVGDSKYDGIRRAAPPTYFVAFPQNTNYRGFAVEIRTREKTTAVTGYVRRAIADVDPNVPLSDLATAEQTVDRLIRQDRLFAALSSSFSALALLLAAIGLYGVRAYSVGRRTSEIGIRMALGASRAAITRMVLRETAWLALFGVAMGLATAYGLTGYIQSMLYGLAARDLAIFRGAAATLIAVATIASYLPAQRAARVDPMCALRHE